MKTKIFYLVIGVLLIIAWFMLAPLINRGYKVHKIESYQAKREQCEANQKYYNEQATLLREQLFLKETPIAKKTEWTGTVTLTR